MRCRRTSSGTRQRGGSGLSLRFDIVTLFPEIFFGPLGESIVGRAEKKGIVQIQTVNLRRFTHDKRGTVDDVPFGGGAGMLMKPEPLFEAVESLKSENSKVILTSPAGVPFSQRLARSLAKEEHLIVLCGHYEGVDQRVIDSLVDMEISIGDFVLTSGNLPAMVILDAVTRLLPGVLGSPESDADESFETGLLEYPQYTRPADYKGLKVPDVLLSGNHSDIKEWRVNEAVKRTVRRRPDLFKN